MSAFTHFKEEETRNVLTGKSSTVSNLSKKELRGLKFLKARIKGGELIVGQTDKSSRFCVLTRDQYVKLGLKHTQQDEEIDWKHVKNRVNNVVWRLSKIVHQSVETDESRMQHNIQDHNAEIADTYLVLKTINSGVKTQTPLYTVAQLCQEIKHIMSTYLNSLLNY